jgi:hypothetical protein
MKKYRNALKEGISTSVFVMEYAMLFLWKMMKSVKEGCDQIEA